MHANLRLLAGCLIALMSTTASAAWQVISAEPGKRVEIDRSSITRDERGKTVALGRIILEKPIIDPKTSSAYRIVQALSSYDCTARSYSTLKRSYFKEEGQLLREEEVKVQVEMPVRSGMLDDKLLREVCRPKAVGEAATAARRTADKVNEASGELRKANEALLQKEVKRANLQAPPAEKAEPESKRATPFAPVGRTVASAPAPMIGALAAPRREARPHAMGHAEPPAAPQAHAEFHWSYEAEGGPDNWGRLRPEYATCASGKRQSPIDIRDGFRVDLEPVQFVYRPSQFRVVDNGHTIQVEVSGSSISLLGKNYELVQFHFHRPSEERVNGKSFDMVAHLVHRSEDGRLAVVAVLLEKGVEHPLIQTVWNNLPLEKNEYVTPPGLSIDLGQLLPADKSYYTYMGSLTTPPCSEGVLWLVLKQPQQISPEQLAIFTRLYRHNARPIQPSFGRMIKESR
ncbi:MAG: carbonic anhydrase family protein [Candidatus Accumulibacter sp.]|uniref:carbonic anhydrase n=1 Tax=Accumulibacter sp. TaxID=2053492 RepID=UPI001A45B93B|nr:carbonic anhydrase family protein [Accumulibacter sp.]MBL8393387.1 carbonic anhydrase family protein [Accumulibacter sp.]